MKKNLSPNTMNYEKWIVFAILFNLTIVEVVTGVFEYTMTHNLILILFAFIRILSLLVGVYAVGSNKSTMIFWVTKTLYAGLALSILSFIYIQILIYFSKLENVHGSQIYTILSIIEMIGVFILTRWYISGERTETWKYFRSGAKSQEYIPLDHFQYGNMSKEKRSNSNYSTPEFQHTAEVENGKIMIKVKPISEIIKADIEWNDKDELVSSDDKIDQYDRKSGNSIFLS